MYEAKVMMEIMSRKKYFIWLLPVAVAIMIFCFSAQPAEESAALSNGVVLKMIDFLSRVNGNLNPEILLERLSTPVRKAAHISEYLVFFLTLLAAWFVSGVRRARMVGYAVLVVFFYACSDELHQIFVSGRAGRFTDVLIDCSGAVVLAFILLARWRWKKRKL